MSGEGELNLGDLPEAHSFILRDHIEHVTLRIEGLLGFGWRYVCKGSERPSVVELRCFFDDADFTPAESGGFQILHVAPRALRTGEGVLSMLEAVELRPAEAIADSFASYLSGG